MYRRGVNIRDSVVEQVRNLILEGRWKPGDKLPPQDKLAEEFGISRTSMREALYKLSSLGLIKIEHGKGTFISSRSTASMLETLSLLILNETDELNLLEARTYLEAGTSSLAAERATEEEIEELRELVQEMKIYLDRDQIDSFSDCDLKFHLKIAGIAKNAVLVKLIETIREMLQRQQREVHTIPRAVKSAYIYHEKIMQAVAVRNPTEAQRLMEEHLNYVKEVYVSEIIGRLKEKSDLNLNNKEETLSIRPGL